MNCCHGSLLWSPSAEAPLLAHCRSGKCRAETAVVPEERGGAALPSDPGPTSPDGFAVSMLFRQETGRRDRKCPQTTKYSKCFGGG